MRILATGGSGYIGSAVVAELVNSGHEILALARSTASADRLENLGARPVHGGIAEADAWLAGLPPLDGALHMAASFDDRMTEMDAAFITALIRHIHERGEATRLVYTGGVWLYGDCGGRPAFEGQAFNPLPAFAFMAEQRARLFAQAAFPAMIVHPGLVWDEAGGLLTPLLADADRGGPIRLPDRDGLRWPLVHRHDLARLYRLALERGMHGRDYHGVAEPAVPAERIAEILAQTRGLPATAIVKEQAAWSEGYHLDQTVLSDRTRSELDWQPQQPPILQALSPQP